MKCFKYVLCMMMGAGIAILVETYEKEIKCACQKIMNKEQELMKNGLETD